MAKGGAASYLGFTEAVKIASPPAHDDQPDAPTS